MNKIRTVEQLSDYLDEQIAWRKRELASIKSLIRSTSSLKQISLLRSGIAILYAHWEGFVRETGTAYLYFIVMQRLNYSDLATNFVALAMKRQLNEATHSNKASVYTEVAEFFRSGLGKRSRIPWKTAIDTQSNLSSIIFREIVTTLGLDYRAYRTKEKLIDEKLLHKRNRIAHGDYLGVSEREYIELHEQVVGLMEQLRSDIINAALMGVYKRT